MAAAIKLINGIWQGTWKGITVFGKTFSECQAKLMEAIKTLLKQIKNN